MLKVNYPRWYQSQESLREEALNINLEPLPGYSPDFMRSAFFAANSLHSCRCSVISVAKVNHTEAQRVAILSAGSVRSARPSPSSQSPERSRGNLMNCHTSPGADRGLEG